jgi:hypothetical protein
MNITYAPSFEKFLEALGEQIHQHGRPACQAKDDPMSRSIGFTSPDGWFLAALPEIKAWLALQDQAEKPQTVREALQAVWDAAPS